MPAPSVILEHIPTFTNKYFDFVANQRFAFLDSFQPESGVELLGDGYLQDMMLKANRYNCLVICHALCGSSNIED
jgi:hypothetical protein